MQQLKIEPRLLDAFIISWHLISQCCNEIAKKRRTSLSNALHHLVLLERAIILKAFRFYFLFSIFSVVDRHKRKRRKRRGRIVAEWNFTLYFTLLGGLFCHQSSRVKLSDVEEKVVKTKLETRPENLFSHFWRSRTLTDLEND